MALVRHRIGAAADRQGPLSALRGEVGGTMAELGV